MSNILLKHRTAALLGAALIAGTAALPFTINAASAVAAPAEVSGTFAPGGSFAPIVDADKPAVVTVTTTMKATDTSDQQSSPMDEQFRQFFEQQGIPMPRQAPQHDSGQHAMALGSGFIISPDGVIVTNNHVIDNAIDIKVTLDDGTELPAKLVGTDPKSDIAVLKIQAPKPLATVAWGDSDKLKLGDQILAIGNPFGIGTTVTAGIVSARGRDLHSGPYDDFIQIDAPVNKGNSGGPAFDTNGEVMGVNTAIYSPSGGSVGIAFSIPASTVKSVIAQLKDKGTVSRGWIGVQIQPVTADIADSLGMKKAEGALVAEPQANGPAAKAGIQSGDVITAVNGEPVKDARELARTIGGLAPGNAVKLNVLQKGQDKVVNLTLGQLPNTIEAKANIDQEDKGSATKGTGVPKLGLTLAPANSVAGAGKDGVVVTEVDPKSAAAERGFKEGDVILEVAGKSVANVGEVRDAIDAARTDNKNSVLMRVKSGGSSRFVAVPLAKG